MSRYIDADRLRKDILGLPNCYNGFRDTYDKALIIDRIDEQPTADVRENEHACWILDTDGMDWGLPAWRCSRCGFINNNIGVVEDTGGLEQNPFLWAGSKYCPNCGAQMRQKTANPMGSIKVPKMPTATQPINGEPTISPL